MLSQAHEQRERTREHAVNRARQLVALHGSVAAVRQALAAQLPAEEFMLSQAVTVGAERPLPTPTTTRHPFFGPATQADATDGTAPSPLPGIIEIVGAGTGLSSRFMLDTLKKFAASSTHVELESLHARFGEAKQAALQNGGEVPAVSQVGAPTCSAPHAARPGPLSPLPPSPPPPPTSHHPHPHLYLMLQRSTLKPVHAIRQLFADIRRVAGKTASRRAMRAMAPQVQFVREAHGRPRESWWTKE